MPGAILAYDASMDNINVLLEKVRKGATAGLNEKALTAVLARLGGSLAREVVDLDTESYVYLGAQAFDFQGRRGDEGDPRRVAERLVAQHSKPLKKPGDVRVVGEPKCKDTSCDVPCTVRAVAYRVALGEHSALLMPKEGELRFYARDVLEGGAQKAPAVPLYAVMAWLAERGWKERAAAALGVEPHTPALPRTRANTGTCGVCFANVKLDGGRLVLHGYQRPGDGMAHGRCWGVDRAPFEISPDATRDYTDRGLTPRREGMERRVAELALGGMVLGTPEHPVPPSSPRWPSKWAAAKDNAARALASAQEEEAAYRRLLQFWKVRPLPREGDLDPQWFHHGQKPDPNDAPAAAPRAKTLWDIGE